MKTKACALSLALGTVSTDVASSANRAASGDVQQIVASWPTDARKAAETLIGKYGPPDEATSERLIWS